MPTAGTKKKKQPKKEVLVTDLARSEDIRRWIEDSPVELSLDVLRLDVDRTMGQIRQLNPKTVETKYQQLLQNTPTTLVNVGVWRVKEDGVSPLSLLNFDALRSLCVYARLRICVRFSLKRPFRCFWMSGFECMIDEAFG